ncbi:hypothetical protein [Salinigranum sp. GCM10025319]|uniref:hypothetical protein n=1 Tax=Salinigranum sp. GCM10025319 TaxID=3252687 RepID=UPI00360DC7AA
MSGRDDDSADDGTDGDSGEGTDRNDGVDADTNGDADLPADVEATLAQLLAEAAGAARRRDIEEVTAVVDTVETVSRNKVPAGDLRERLEHGCATVDRLVADEPLVAAEYLDAMERLVRSA